VSLSETHFHVARATAADWLNSARRATSLGFSLRGKAEQSLRDAGFAVVENFLTDNEFAAVRQEAHEAVEMTERAVPIGERIETGFGKQQPHDWGFDRYDGGTLNRFIDIDAARMPAINRFAHNEQVKRLCRAAIGTQLAPRRTMIYLTVNGNEERNHDLQKDMHRDSCFRKVKFWYFIDEVAPDDGPFVYVPGSHRMTRQRMDWEHEMARKNVRPGGFRDTSFRIRDDELPALGLGEPTPLPVAGNTLVIADTFGFHRRGDAKPGSRRLSLYAQKKPWPFTPVGF
jgi:hypothetical protein